jgi:hypothetical protein
MNKFLAICISLVSINSFAQDVYNSATNQLSIPSVLVGSTTYTNVVVTVGNVISIGGSNAPPPNNFNLQIAYQNLVQSGYSKTFNISGTCNGTATSTISPPQSGFVFNGVGAFQVTTVLNDVFNGCTPNSILSTTQAYYDINFNYLGSSTTGLFVAFVGGAKMPTNVTNGSAGLVGNANTYTDSTKASLTGTAKLTYVVGQGSNGTLNVTLITQLFNNSQQLLVTSQAVYSLTSNNTLTLISIDTQASTTSTTHLAYN